MTSLQDAQASPSIDFSNLKTGDWTYRLQFNLHHAEESKAWVQHAEHTEHAATLHFRLNTQRLPILIKQSPLPFIADTQTKTRACVSSLFKEAPSNLQNQERAFPHPFRSPSGIVKNLRLYGEKIPKILYFNAGSKHF